jgi:hypothetical protein
MRVTPEAERLVSGGVARRDAAGARGQRRVLPCRRVEQVHRALAGGDQHEAVTVGEGVVAHAVAVQL